LIYSVDFVCKGKKGVFINFVFVRMVLADAYLKPNKNKNYIHDKE